MAKRFETRLDKLEKTVAQQGYVVLMLLIVFAFDTAAVVLLWQERGKPDFDHIAVALTVFQTLFGLAAFAGFWTLRTLTKEQAAEKAEEVALEEIRRIAPSLISREVLENIEAFRRAGPISDAQATAMLKATADEPDPFDED